MSIEQGRHFPDLPAVQAYLDALTASDWWEERFPRVVRIEAQRIASRSVLAVGRCDGQRGAGVVGLSTAGQDEVVVLHEVAHAVGESYEGHGLQWRRRFLELVYRVMGREAWEALRAALAEGGTPP